MLPLQFSYIHLKKSEHNLLKSILIENNVGLSPLCLDFDSSFPTDLIPQVLKEISVMLRNMNISSRFPYPFYIICDQEVVPSDLLILRSKKELPDFFLNQWKRPGQKESALLKKITYLRQKLNTIDFRSHIQLSQQVKHEQKKLVNLIKENEFYQDLISKLNRKMNNRN